MGVSPKADNRIIKKAYRKLAFRYHPDKNFSVDSSKYFHEVNEAYNVLSNRDSRRQYDQLLTAKEHLSSQVTTPMSRHRDPAYRRNRTSNYRPPTMSRKQERIQMMNHFCKHFKAICIVGLAFCGFIFLDFVLPEKVTEEEIVSGIPKSRSERKYKYDNIEIFTNQGGQYELALYDKLNFPIGSKVEVFSTRILKIVVRLKSKTNGFVTTRLANIYQNMIFAPLVLFMVSLFGITVIKGVELTFNVGISICCILILNIIILIYSMI